MVYNLKAGLLKPIPKYTTVLSEVLMNRFKQDY